MLKCWVHKERHKRRLLFWCITWNVWYTHLVHMLMNTQLTLNSVLTDFVNIPCQCTSWIFNRVFSLVIFPWEDEALQWTEYNPAIRTCTCTDSHNTCLKTKLCIHQTFYVADCTEFWDKIYLTLYTSMHSWEVTKVFPEILFGLLNLLKSSKHLSFWLAGLHMQNLHHVCAALSLPRADSTTAMDKQRIKWWSSCS